MTADKVREVIAVYRRKFEEMGVPKRKAPHDSFPATDAEYLAHCHAMLDEMEEFLDQGRIEKVFRWLGFNQGCLWRCGIYTIEEMKEHNRPR
jgi:hypothetical protein